jgi:MinD-like ATPase involved in chromosome partitioning or flagellar assembly
VLLDTDVVEPSVAAVLNLNPAKNAYMVSLEDPGSDPLRWAVGLEGELQRLDVDSSPLSAVLCGVPKPGLRGAFTPAFLTMLLSQLRLHYRYIVADVGSIIDEGSSVSASHRAVLSTADRVLVVATPDIVGLRRTAALLATLRRDGEHEPNRLALVLNRHRSRHHHSAAEIAQTLRVSVAAVVAEDGDAFQRALSAQRPLVAFGRGQRGSAARAFHELADLVEEAHSEWRGGAAAGLSIDGRRPVAADTPVPLKRHLLSVRWPQWRPSWPKAAGVGRRPTATPRPLVRTTFSEHERPAPTGEKGRGGGARDAVLEG